MHEFTVKTSKKYYLKRSFIVSAFVFLFFNLYSTTYYVSENGNDGASGLSETSAWRTISKVNSVGLNPGDKVLFNRGDIFTGSLKLSASGTSGSRIIYGAYGSGKLPVLSGYKTLTSWSNYSTGIYRTFIGNVPGLKIVEFDGKIKPKGRYPNDKYLYFESHNSKTSITDNELSASPNWTGAELVIVSSRWTIDKLPIISHNGTDIYYGGVISYEPRHDDFGYFIQNDIRTLDQLGEWYYDGSYLYVYFGNEFPSSHTVKASIINDIVYSNLKNYTTFENIKFEGANRYGFYGYVSNDITIQNCEIEDTEISAIRGQSCRNFSIINNVINYSNNFAVDIDKGEPYATINNNTISNTGLFPGMGDVQSIGIRVLCDNSKVQFNRIENTGYSPILFNGSNVLIEKNYINNFCFLLDDGGGIYTYHGLYTDVPKNRYSNRKVISNIVLNGIGMGPSGASKNNTGTNQAAGIFFDGGSGAAEVRNNTVWNCGYSGIACLNSHNMIISDNTFYDNLAQIRLSHRAVQDPISDVTFTNNILFAKDFDQLGLHYWVQDLKGETAVNDIAGWGYFNNNYYCKPADETQVFLNTGAGGGAYRSLAEWSLFTGHEKNSKITPVSVKDLNQVELLYNASNENKTIPITSGAVDVKLQRYSQSVTLAPFSSVILIHDDIISSVTNTAPAIANQTFTIGNVEPGGFIGKVLATDPNSQQTISYKIVAGNDKGYFWISPSNGNLYTTSSYDSNVDLSGMLTVEVTDNGSPALSTRAEISIVHQLSASNPDAGNLNPVVFDQTFSIGEISAGGFIGKVIASDPNTDQSINYKIYSGNESGNFWISSLSGNLYTTPSYNPSVNLSGSLVVTVTDNGTPQLSSNAIITIEHFALDNQSPVIEPQVFNIGYVDPAGFIGTVKADDPDAGQSLSYKILSGNDDGNFWISPVNGNLYTTSSYDPNSNISGLLSVQVTDNGTPVKSSQAVITIDQSNVGNQSPLIEDQTFTISYIEPGNYIGTVIAEELDAGQTLSYKIISGNDLGYFWISPINGNLYTTSNYSTSENLSGTLTIRVTDNGSPVKTADANVIIDHTTGNLAPVISNQTFTFGYVEPTGFIGTVQASDPEGQALSYKIISGNASGNFWISPKNGNLYTTSNYNSSVNLSGSLLVEVTDNGTPLKSSSAEVVLNHTISLNVAPVINDQLFTVGYLEPGGFIGKVKASDPNDGQSLSYEIIAGNDDGNFWISPINGNLYTTPSYSSIVNISGVITVQVKDNGTPVKLSSASISIVHTISGNNAPVILNQTFTIGYTEPGGFIGTVKATDPDLGQSLTYKIVSGNESGNFWISPINGNLYTTPGYDPNSNISSNLIVRVTDNGTPIQSSDGTVSINHTVNKTVKLNSTDESSLYSDTLLNTKIYPNPFVGHFNVNIRVAFADVINVYIYDLGGNVVGVQSFRNVKDQLNIEFRLDYLDDGIYIVKVITEKEAITKEIVKVSNW
ncbi:cadherin domain-containing protein [Saccharicrinis sp. FJH54]|uniref:cadherin domain-containing protein n=1 Tax=Saccharicrinis sp. FJH54 TaxID=3344665 RepID=UPI0035D434DC